MWASSIEVAPLSAHCVFCRELGNVSPDICSETLLYVDPLMHLIQGATTLLGAQMLFKCFFKVYWMLNY